MGSERPRTRSYIRSIALLPNLQAKLQPDCRCTIAGHITQFRGETRVRTSFIRFMGVFFSVWVLVQSVALGQSAHDIKTLTQQVLQLYSQGKYPDATKLAEHTLSLAENTLGPEHSETLTSVSNLGFLYDVQGRFGEAEPLYKRALAGTEKALGREHPSTLVSVGNLAALYYGQGRYGEAEPLLKRALVGTETALGAEHPHTLRSVNNLAELYRVQGRHGEAEPLCKRALSGREKVLGQQHPDTLRSVNNLAVLYQEQGRYSEAEPLYARALTGYEKMLGPDHPETLTSVHNLGFIYQAQERYDEAEPLLRRALDGIEKVLGPEHPSTLASVHNLGYLYQMQRRDGEAEPLYKRALTGKEKVLGQEHPSTLTSVNNLADLYGEQGRYGEAEPLYKRALAGTEKVLGPEHPLAFTSASNLARLYFAQSNWSSAAVFWRHSTSIIAKRVQRDALSAELTGKRRSEAERLDWQFWGLVKVAYRLAPEGRALDGALSNETFKIAQWALSSEAARSLAQMAARGARGNPRLAKLVRERQDLVDEWQGREKNQAAALGQDTAVRDAEVEAENRMHMDAIDRRLGEIDKQLKVEFSEYAALASPVPLAVEDVQARLGGDEALVLFLDTPELPPTPEETFIWVVTKTKMRWVRSELGQASLAREVAALRCGLDRAGWEGQSRCAELTGQSRPGTLLPFDHIRAYQLYKGLFAEIKDLIKGKHLLIVPSGALTQLPFAVLETAPSERDTLNATWLVRDHAITVLPAVSSLTALRATSHPSAATKPLVGFGNPLLDGGDQNSPVAKLAREKQACPKTAWQRVSALFGFRDAVAPLEMRGLADVSLIRHLAPLPETADELCAVASDIGADLSEVHLGARATEREVKALSNAGKLAQYRVVHFATHGAMAGELRDSSEPGLILTPPNAATDDDDGYLTASEIAALKFDADWVILSACNTAAGNAQNAQALSGLARAFIYAQTRALLVSHWAVDSDATVKLITGAMREIARDKSVGRSEALRRAMLAMINTGGHPASWAPFIVVGEGAH